MGVNRLALSRRAGDRSSRQERKLLWAWLTRCVFFSLAGQLDVFECKHRFYLIKKTYPGILFPDTADSSRRVWEVEAVSSRVLERAQQGTGLHLFRAGDGVHSDIERGKLGRRRRARRGWQAWRAQHARESRPGQIFVFGQSGTMGRVQGYIAPY